MWIVAGPNGAGKSTYLKSIAELVNDIVRPDEIAARLSPGAPEAAALSAGRQVVAQMTELVASRRSFAVETTLSGQLHLRLAQHARQSGWKINLTYIGLKSPDLARRRVLRRAQTGGHNVPPNDIIRRYHRSLESLKTFFEFADEVRVLDNSSAQRRMKLIITAQRGKITWRTRRMPKWLGPILLRR